MSEQPQAEPEVVVDGWKRKTIGTLGMAVVEHGPVPEDQRDPERDGKYSAKRHRDRQKKAEEPPTVEDVGVSSP